MSADWSTKQRRPPGNNRREQGVQRLAANPRLNPKPTAGDDRTHQRWKIRSVSAIACARENREGNSVLRAGVGVKQNWNQDDRVAQQYRD